MMRRKARSYSGAIQTSGLFGLAVIVGVVIFQTVTTQNQPLRTYLHYMTYSLGEEARFETLSFNQSKPVALQPPRRSLIFDVVSIGSKTRPAYQDAQQKTLGSAIRHFFRITEDDDYDQACHQNLTAEDSYQISRFCKSRRWEKERFVMQYMRRTYAGVGWLNKKANPAGWMCAQRRSIHGFTKAIKFYREKGEALPDYLIVMDDDTYYNMELVSQYLSTMAQNESLALSGCMFRIPIYEINFTFPFGGWGLMYSRQALDNMLRPIRCDKQSDGDAFLQGSCKALENDQIAERAVFREGMSLTELMDAYASWHPYSDYRNWSKKSKGFCLHGDWVWGYFTNFYPISIHDPDPLFQDVPHARLQPYNGANVYSNQPDPRNISSGGQCNRSCTVESHMCHYQTPRMMEQLKARFQSSLVRS